MCSPVNGLGMRLTATLRARRSAFFGRGLASRQPLRRVKLSGLFRPSLLTENELLGIVDALIRDRAFNRPAAVAIAMAVGAAVEAEVRERCANLCDERAAYYDAGDADRPDSRRAIACQACASVIRGA